MRVISKFHDYYDGVQGLGQDRSLVYVREQRELTEAEAAAYQCPWPLRTEAISAKGFILYFFPFWVAVAGKRYRGIRVRKDVGSTPPYFTEIFFYSLDACREHAVKLTGSDPFAETRGWRSRWSWERDRVTEAEWFSAQGANELHAVMAERGHAVVACSGKQTAAPPYRLLPPDLNPRLADYDFFKVLDPLPVFPGVEHVGRRRAAGQGCDDGQGVGR